MVRYDQFSLGGEVECELGDEYRVTKHNYKALFAKDNDTFLTGLYLTNTRPKNDDTGRKWDSTAGLIVWHKLSNDTEISADVSQDPLQVGKAAPNIKLAGLYKLDHNTTLKTRFETEKGRLGLSYRFLSLSSFSYPFFTF